MHYLLHYVVCVFWHVGKGAIQTEDWTTFFFSTRLEIFCFSLYLSLTHSLVFLSHSFQQYAMKYSWVNFLTSKAARTIRGTEVGDVSSHRLSNDAEIVSRQMLISRGNEWINRFYFATEKISCREHKFSALEMNL
jgi:hypothetical protein